MHRVSVMYPNQPNAKFDFDYYCNTHMELVRKHLKPFGLIKTEVDRGVPGADDQPAPYVCVGHLYFESQEGYTDGIAETGTILRGDISNFTDITPERQISEIIG